ncbi:MAG: hypothetical protein GF417_02775 [Candidatus Latescibacteria bacterium]|nr:hypothetical protein [bacterium]MBD3423353.1 hypothetical protein [Candidatus Latescibacterota bacterium]
MYKTGVADLEVSMNSKVRNILLALMIILIIYFEIHSCSENEVLVPEPEVVENIVYNASDLYFINSREGWIVGQMGTVARTADGGESWESEVIDSLNLNSIYFVDNMNGWIVGEESSLYRTTNGGDTWQKIEPEGLPGDDIFNDVYFLDVTAGYILGRQGLYKTVNGGDAWENNWLPVDESKGAWDFCMVDPERIFLLGSRWNQPDPELLYSSGDGADTWVQVEGTNYSILEGILTIFFIDENNGWGAGARIMKTADGGNSWITQENSTLVRDIAFVDQDRGFTVGADRIATTADGGETWTEILENDDRIVDLRSIYFLDENYGWIAGRGREEVMGGITCQNSLLISTTNGGASWEVKELPWKIE